MTVDIKLRIDFYENDRRSIHKESSMATENLDFAETTLFICLAIRQMSNLANDAFDLATSLKDWGKGTVIDQADIPSEYAGIPGKTRFLADLEFDEHETRFHLYPEGFNFLGLGIKHYASLSVVQLAQYLVSHRSDDETYKNRIAYAANLCGQQYFKGISPIRQMRLTRDILQQAYQAFPNTEIGPRFTYCHYSNQECEFEIDYLDMFMPSLQTWPGTTRISFDLGTSKDLMTIYVVDPTSMLPQKFMSAGSFEEFKSKAVNGEISPLELLDFQARAMAQPIPGVLEQVTPAGEFVLIEVDGAPAARGEFLTHPYKPFDLKSIEVLFQDKDAMIFRLRWTFPASDDAGLREAAEHMLSSFKFIRSRT